MHVEAYAKSAGQSIAFKGAVLVVLLEKVLGLPDDALMSPLLRLTDLLSTILMISKIEQKIRESLDDLDNSALSLFG